MRRCVVSGISTGFPVLSQNLGQVAHVLLTRSPLGHPPEGGASLDLHVLSTPPAFVLSQDQTLRECSRDIPIALALSGTAIGGMTDPVHCVLASVLCIKGTSSDQRTGYQHIWR